jgi:uncharacterized membrane protein YfcA
MQRGLIDRSTRLLNLSLAPCVLLGLLGGRWIVRRIPQRAFESVLLIFSAVAAIRLIAF